MTTNKKFLLVQYSLILIEILYLFLTWQAAPEKTGFDVSGQRTVLLPISIGGLLFGIGLARERFSYPAIILLILSVLGILSMSDKFIMTFK